MYLKIFGLMALACTVSAAPTERQEIQSVVDIVINLTEIIVETAGKVLDGQRIKDIVASFEDRIKEIVRQILGNLDKIMMNVQSLADIVEKHSDATTACILSEKEILGDVKDAIIQVIFICGSNVQLLVEELNLRVQETFTNLELFFERMKKTTDDCRILETSARLECLKKNRIELGESAFTLVSQLFTLRKAIGSFILPFFSCVNDHEDDIRPHFMAVASLIDKCVLRLFTSRTRRSTTNDLESVDEEMQALVKDLDGLAEKIIEDVVGPVIEEMQTTNTDNRNRIIAIINSINYSIEQIKSNVNETMTLCIEKHEKKMKAREKSIIFEIEACFDNALWKVSTTTNLLTDCAKRAKKLAEEAAKKVVVCRVKLKNIEDIVSCKNIVVSNLKRHKEAIETTIVTVIEQLEESVNDANFKADVCAKTQESILEDAIEVLAFDIVSCLII